MVTDTIDRDTPVSTHDVVVVGAGFSGLAALRRLRDAGVRDVVVLDRGDTVGGTWRDNTYPGAACDIPSNLYSLSFDLHPDWSRGYPTQAELHDYLRGVVARHDLARHLRTGRTVTGARWDEDAARWEVTCADGERFRARVLVSAIGFLRDGRIPALPGLDTFAGDVLHTAAWDHDIDLRGRRVGVVGTGASAIQVIPEVAELAAHTTVFMRTPPYVMPRHDRRRTAVERWAYRHVPGLQRLVRNLLYVQKEGRFVFFVGPIGDLVRTAVEHRSLRHMRAGVRNPELRRRLTPDYPMGCKRVLLSSDFYPTLERDDVALTSALTSATPDGAVDADGATHDLDVLVFATGYQVDRPLGDLTITGRDGRDLATVWGDKPSAYLGAAVPGFPNMFAVIGPNCGLGHNSMVFMAEAHLRQIVPLVVDAVTGDAVLEVRDEALVAFEDEMDRRSRDTVWESGCSSWYVNDNGENALLWPASTVEFWWRNGRSHDDAYRRRPTATAAG